MTIVKKETAYVEHILRNNQYLPQNIMQGRVERNKGVGGKKKSWLRNIRDRTHLSVEKIFHRARSRSIEENGKWSLIFAPSFSCYARKKRR